jgi:hypothetical protein
VNYNSSTDLDRFQYAYDRHSSRTSRDNMLTAGLDELYARRGQRSYGIATMDLGIQIAIGSGSIASPASEQGCTPQATGAGW